MIKLSINVTKIDKARLVKGEKGTYLNIVCFDKPDNYGNDGFVAMDRSKEEREAGTTTPIIGNWRRVGIKPAGKPTRPAPTPRHDEPEMEPPF